MWLSPCPFWLLALWCPSAVWIWPQVFSETGTSQGEGYVLPDIAQPSSTNNLVSEVVMADRLPVILVI